MNTPFPRLAPVGLLAILALSAGSGCSKEYVRGSDEPGIDRPAMGTGLDKDDIERTLQTLLNQMREAPIMMAGRMKAAQTHRQTVAIAPFSNATTRPTHPRRAPLR